MANNGDPSSFELALETFKAGLKKNDRVKFTNVKLQDLLDEMDKIQNDQQPKRRAKNLARLKPFLEAMEQFGKVIEVFTNTSEMVAFVWVTSAFAKAFHDLLDIYEKIGGSISGLLQFESLFRRDQNMLRVLSMVWKDILAFHHQAMEYFQKPSRWPSTPARVTLTVPPVWKQLFHATWDTYKSRFGPLIDNIRGHGALIQTQATLSQIEAFQRDAELRDAKFRSISEMQESQRLSDLKTWLHATSCANEQKRYSDIRQEFPGTGRWLLDNQSIKEWMDPKYPTIPPLLWLNGIPGAGKTILASLIVEECRKLSIRLDVLYFYCKHGDTERNNFISLGRSFLSQLLENNRDSLLPFYYERFSKSLDPVLCTQEVIENLLEVAILNCSDVYIVIDGIDECPRDERRKITQWFRHLVEDLEPPRQDRVRCLFVSQYDGVAQRDFGGLTAVQIKAHHTRADIQQFSMASAAKIQDDLGLPDDLRVKVTSRIEEAADGMFLLAKLIADILGDSTSIEDIEVELQNDVLPTELKQAYARIMLRLFNRETPNKRDSRRAASLFILKWLVCAKRTVKWREIQAAKAVDIDSQTVDMERRRFRQDCKDLCGSMVEMFDDGSVDLVHTTAKFFLIEENHVQLPQEDLSLANFCVDYLNLEGFHDGASRARELFPNGYFALMDYAVPYWIRHLEIGLAKVKEDHELPKTLPESLEAFLDLHFLPPTKQFYVSQSNVKRLQFFENQPFYERLQTSIISARKELTFVGEMKQGELALKLSTIVRDIRKQLESIYEDAEDESERIKMRQIYGADLYKCPRLSCRFFYNGFASNTQRDQHVDKHLRPFRCDVAGCPSAAMGMSSEKELKKHKKTAHDIDLDDELDFPEEQELLPQEQQQARNRKPEQATSRSSKVSKPPKEKRPRITEYPCTHCHKVFNKKYNRDSHLVTHKNERDIPCGICGALFAREHDRNRHEATTHAAEKEFVCGGVLEDGRRWGCDKRFTRADTLRHHYRTAAGQGCRPPWLQTSELSTAA
ncbi:hypothetical protein DL768_007171 [Monosporascus sp. mg162]|nr:hypothetical protein DL768_007171 [Monosporascus sp. mg162]